MAFSAATSIIVAQAFRYLELAPPSSFGDDSEKARDAAEMYPVAMSSCLAACDWSFASTSVSLPALAALPTGIAAEDAYPYSYQLPGDFVKMQEVGDGDVDFRIDASGLLRADAPAPLRVRFTRRLTNEAILPADFQDAVALRLACYLGNRDIGTTSKLDRLEQLAKMRLQDAMRGDRGNASSQRYDGRDDEGFWADEVTL